MAAQLDEALQRFQAALGLLETAINRAPEAPRSDIETELQIMGDDRARLAVELEGTAARLDRVESAAEHVGQRVDAALLAVQEILSRQDRAQAAEA